MKKNKVIIIGGDHYNTLGVIRSFGENGIKPFLFVVSDTNLVSIIKSKYIEKYWICENEEQVIKELINNFDNEKDKPVIIPTSDKAASILDFKFDELSKKYIVQNINNSSNQINKYMNKYIQFQLSKKYKLNMAYSQFLSTPFKKNMISNRIKYPFIVKPLMSINGEKRDISIVYNDDDLNRLLNVLNNQRYGDVLIQELIDFDYECDMSGYCYNSNIAIAGYVKKERIWPLKRGSMTFGHICKYESMQKEISKIENLIKDLNYNGMFDVEFFVKSNKLYLNEINFRNSGLTYLYKNSYLCYYYYLSVINDKFSRCPKISSQYSVMNELAELHQVIDRNISLSKYLLDKRKCSVFLIYNKFDKKPFKYMLINKIRKIFRKNKRN